MASRSAVDHNKILALLNIQDDTEERHEDETTSGDNSLNRKPWQKFTKSLFMVMYLMSKSTRVSQFVAYAISLINTLQMMSYAFNSPQFHWNSGFRDAVKPTFQILILDFFHAESGSESMAKAALLVTISVIVSTAFLLVWAGKQVWDTGMVYYQQVLQLLRLVLRLLATVLFMPTCSILIGAFDCSVLGFCEQTPVFIAVSVFIGTLLVSFVVFTCLTAVSFVDNSPASENAVSQVHGRADCAFLLIRAVVSLAFALFPNATGISLASVILASGVLSTGIYLIYMPYLHRNMNRWVVGCHSAYMWAGICLVLEEMLWDGVEGNAAFVTFIMGLPFVVVLFAAVVMLREVNFSKLEPKPNDSDFHAELNLRYKFDPHQANWKECQNAYRKYVDDMFATSPYMLLNLASLFSSCGANSLLAGQYVRRANQSRGKNIDHRFLIFCSFKRQQELKNGTTGAINYMTLKLHQSRSETHILDSIESAQAMYKLLGTDSYTADQVFAFARKIKRSSARAKENLEELIKITKSSPRSLLLYSLYLREIVNDTSMAQSLYRTAKQQFRKGRDNDSHETQGAIFTISGDESNLGVIIDASDNCETYFGYTSQHLVGKNIDYICPAPFDNGVHYKFLQNYIETCVSMVPVTRHIWARHSNGYVNRMSLHITPVEEPGGGLVFQGQLNITHHRSELVCVDQEGTIMFFTQQMMSWFGMRVLTENDFTKADKNIHKFIPQLIVFNFEAILESNESIKQDIDVGQGESYSVSAQPVNFPVIGAKVLFLELEPIEGGKNSYDEDPEFQQLDDASMVDGFDEMPQSKADPVIRSSTFVESEGGSVGDTASIVSDATSATGKSTSFVHQVVQMRIEAENFRLEKFKRQCMGLAALFIAMVFFSYLANASTFDSFDDMLDMMKLTAERSYLIIETAVTMLHQLMVIVPQTDEAIELVDLLPINIAKNAEALEQLQDLIINSAAFQFQDQLDLMYSPNMVEEFSDDQKFSMTSPFKLLQRFIANARAFKKEDQTKCETSCRYVINNGPWGQVEKSLHSVQLFKDRAMSLHDWCYTLDVALLITSALLVLAIMYFLIMPPLLDVKRVKEEMSEALAQIPVNALKRLAKSSNSKLENIKLEIASINSSANPFVGGGKTKKEINFFQAGSNSRTRETAITNIEKGFFAKMVAKIFRLGGSKIAPANSITTRTRQKLRASFIISLLKLLFPLLLIVAYFAVVLVMFVHVQDQALRHITAVHATAKRWVAIQRMHFSVKSPQGDDIEYWGRWATDSTEELIYESNETRRARMFLDEMIDQEQLILYGSNDISETPLIDKSNPDLYRLFFVDSCTDVPVCMEMKVAGTNDVLLNDMDYGLDVTMSRLIQRTEATLRGENVRIFSYVSMFALSAALKTTVMYFMNDVKSIEKTAVDNMLTGALLCLVLVILVFWFMIKLFRRINDEVVDAQSLLLILPPELVEGVPSLSALVTNVEQ